MVLLGYCSQYSMQYRHRPKPNIPDIRLPEHSRSAFSSCILTTRASNSRGRFDKSALDAVLLSGRRDLCAVNRHTCYARRVSSTNANRPRRPAGFTAPGPRPAGDLGQSDLVPAPDEDLSYLAGDWRIFQPKKGHRWSLDDLLTAWVAVEYAPSVQGLRCVDLGCGLGSVLMLTAWALPDARVWGLEAQPTRAARARRSLRFNGASARCAVVDGDLREIGATLGPLLDVPPTLVTGTPPYFDPNATRRAEDDETAACRVEIRGGLEVYLDAANEILAADGVVVLCYPVSEAKRAQVAGEARGLWLRRRLTVIPREGKPGLIVVDAFSRMPGKVSLDALEVRSRSNAWTEEFRAVRRRFGMPDRP